MNHRVRILLSAVAFYFVWVVATWFFEGRIDTLLRPDAVGARIAYAFLANLLLGVAGGLALLWVWRRQGLERSGVLGFPGGRRTVISMIVGVVLGLVFYFVQGAPSLNPTVIVNAYAQVFVVSAAEIVVCWAVVATAVVLNLPGLRPATAELIAAVIASLLFGLYHYAHSAPFNTLPMVAFLSLIGLGTSAFFFISRDLAGTVLFHNFLGTYGVVRALVAAKALGPMNALQIPLLGTAGLTLIIIGAGYVLIRRAPAQGTIT